VRQRALLVALVALLASACKGERSPQDVAERFLDKYYLEIDQPAALLLTVGPASGRIQAEIADLEAARRQGLETMPSRPRMYYSKLAERPAAAADERELEYDLSIDSQGVKLHKRVDLRLKEDGGHWRIYNFAEADMAKVE
jgi:hypothetical protein